ncbi:MAG: CidA/LrgA family protein [Burkholderiales bacterium]|nr:CidA/LrgA family protein [Burkholderiales bacterium]
MLRGLALLLVFQSLGEVAVRATGMAVPGPVVGMVLLFIFLVVRKQPPESLSQAADGLLSHLAIFYIPAAVGVMLYAKPLAEQGIAWIAAILVSTLGAMLLPALLLKRWLGNQPEVPASEPKSDEDAKP